MKESEMQIAHYTKTNWLKAYSLAWKFIDLLYPPSCVICGKIGYRCCPACWEKRKLYDSQICSICGKPSEKTGLCGTCQVSKPPLKMIRSLGEYDGILRVIILALKYERDVGLAELVLPDLENLLNTSNFEFDILIPVPLSKNSYKERGYNQVSIWGKLLARIVEKNFLPKALWKKCETASQVSLPAEKRWQNVKNTFSANSKIVKDKNVLLLDDVITTGATLYECTNALLEAGSKNVSALTIARSSSKNSKIL